MKMTRYSDPQILAILRQGEGGVPVFELCREHAMSNASFYNWRSKYDGMDASMISQMKALEDQNRRLRKMYAEMSMQSRVTEGSPWEKVIRQALRRGLAENAVARHGVSLALACRTFDVSETCYRWSWRRIFNFIDAPGA